MKPKESTLEEIVLGWLCGLGYPIAHGPDLAPGEAGAEQASYGGVVLEGRLRESLWRLNPDLPQTALEEVLRKVVLADTPSLNGQNRNFHTFQKRDTGETD